MPDVLGDILTTCRVRRVEWGTIRKELRVDEVMSAIAAGRATCMQFLRDLILHR